MFEFNRECLTAQQCPGTLLGGKEKGHGGGEESWGREGKKGDEK
jgi:hypothetical protein